MGLETLTVGLLDSEVGKSLCRLWIINMFGGEKRVTDKFPILAISFALVSSVAVFKGTLYKETG